MTRRYLFIHAAELSRDTEYLQVWLGESMRDVDIKNQLKRLCLADSDYYFQPWSMAVLDFLWRVARSFGMHYSELKIRHVRGVQLVANLANCER